MTDILRRQQASSLIIAELKRKQDIDQSTLMSVELTLLCRSFSLPAHNCHLTQRWTTHGAAGLEMKTTPQQTEMSCCKNCWCCGCSCWRSSNPGHSASFSQRVLLVIYKQEYNKHECNQHERHMQTMLQLNDKGAVHSVELITL